MTRFPLPPAARILLVLAACVPVTATADEAAVQSLLEQRLPNVQIDKVSSTPYPGLYEVFAGGRLLYTDEQATYVIQGTLVDVKTRKNLSSERLKQLTAISFEQLPLADAIRIVKGDGSRRLAIFEDPDCPYCRLLEAELGKIDNITIHIFLYPIESLHRGATAKSRRIWCAEDRAQAWQDAALKGVVADNPGTCDTPLARIADFGRRMQIDSTPTLFFGDGRRVSGMIPAAQIEQLLATTVPAPPAASRETSETPVPPEPATPAGSPAPPAR